MNKNASESRSPYGERGLKCLCGSIVVCGLQSLSLRRAWIEITRWRATDDMPSRRSPYGERGLKCHEIERREAGAVSLSLRRAWIEITDDTWDNMTPVNVALLTESVD